MWVSKLKCSSTCTQKVDLERLRCDTLDNILIHRGYGKRPYTGLFLFINMIDTYYGIKLEMTQVWDKSGVRIPVTVIKADPLVVTQVKGREKDGYQAVQVGFGEKKKLNKAIQNHVKKSKVSPRYLREIKTDDEINVGDELEVSEVFTGGEEVIVRSISKGRGFTGVIKRWGFGGGPRTHGQSDRERAPGSIGQGTDPGRVHRGKKMPGRHGNQQKAIRSLKVVKVDEEKNEIWISGPIPGPAGAVVQIIKTGEFDFDGLYHDKSTDEKEKGDEIVEEKTGTEGTTSNKVEKDEKKTDEKVTEDKREKKDDGEAKKEEEKPSKSKKEDSKKEEAGLKEKEDGKKEDEAE